MINKVIDGNEVLVSEDIGNSITLNGNPLQFNTDSEQVSTNTVITLEPIQSGSGDPSPSNVRKITGYDNIIITVSNENLLDGVSLTSNKYLLPDGTIEDNEYWNISDYINIEGIKTLYVFDKKGYVLGGTPAICWYDSSKNFIGGSAYNSVMLFDVDLPSNAKYIRASVNITDDRYYFISSKCNYTSKFLDSTIYGGTLDVESGKLVVDKKLYTYNGSENWTQNYSLTGTYYVIYPDDVLIKDNVNTKTNMYKVGDVTTTNLTFYCGMSFNVKDETNGATLSDFITYLSSHNLQVLFPLATPITYYLSPTQIKLLQGSNVVTTNGTSIQLTYRDGEIAKLEDLNGLVDGLNGLAGRFIKYKDIDIRGVQITTQDTTGLYYAQIDTGIPQGSMLISAAFSGSWTAVVPVVQFSRRMLILLSPTSTTITSSNTRTVRVYYY